jgi:hypothetical protein
MTDQAAPTDPLTIQIPGDFPDGVRVVKVSGNDAQRLADLGLHRSDLRFARESLDAINHPNITPHIQESLWRSAFVHLYKCFQNSKSRASLDADVVYDGAPVQARLNFDYFRNVRNKQMVHDENSSTQSDVIAILNDGTKPNKVEAVRVLAVSFQMLGPQGQKNYESFYQVVQRVDGWVAREFDKLERKIYADLEKLTYQELVALPTATGRVPTLEDVALRRSR